MTVIDVRLAVAAKWAPRTSFQRSSAVCSCEMGSAVVDATIATWLILPVVICLSQRLSHACLSTNFYTVKLRMAH